MTQRSWPVQKQIGCHFWCLKSQQSCWTDLRIIVEYSCIAIKRTTHGRIRHHIIHIHLLNHQSWRVQCRLDGRDVLDLKFPIDIAHKGGFVSWQQTSQCEDTNCICKICWGLNVTHQFCQICRGFAQKAAIEELLLDVAERCVIRHFYFGVARFLPPAILGSRMASGNAAEQVNRVATSHGTDSSLQTASDRSSTGLNVNSVIVSISGGRGKRPMKLFSSSTSTPVFVEKEIRTAKKRHGKTTSQRYLFEAKFVMSFVWKTEIRTANKSFFEAKFPMYLGVYTHILFLC